jgi:hypothetical protein
MYAFPVYICRSCGNVLLQTTTPEKSTLRDLLNVRVLLFHLFTLLIHFHDCSLMQPAVVPMCAATQQHPFSYPSPPGCQDLYLQENCSNRFSFAAFASSFSPLPARAQFRLPRMVSLVIPYMYVSSTCFFHCRHFTSAGNRSALAATTRIYWDPSQVL